MSLISPVSTSRTAAAAQFHHQRLHLTQQVDALLRQVRELEAQNAALEAKNKVNEERLEHTEGCRLTGRAVLASVSAQRKMPIRAILSHDRSKSIVRVRFEAIYQVARCCPWLSYPEIGRLFGGRDHTTILHAINKWPEYALDLGIVCLPLDRERVPE